jgi:hypothetical protein
LFCETCATGLARGFLKNRSQPYKIEITQPGVKAQGEEENGELRIWRASGSRIVCFATASTMLLFKRFSAQEARRAVLRSVQLKMKENVVKDKSF